MISYYVTYFTIMSFIGYIYESIAMTLWSGKWENRGFLYGPVIPIYGVGSLAILLIFNNLLDESCLSLVFAVGFFGSAILEYPTSLILEKLFHAYWWDYSSAPFNIEGRVSLFSSLGFGLAAIIIIYYINPLLLPIINSIGTYGLEILSYLFIVLFTVDITLTVSVLTEFETRVNKLQEIIDAHLDEAVDNINPKGRNIKGALKYTKQNIIDTRVDKLYDSMGGIYHGAISRIKGFRSGGSDTIHTIKNKIKNRVDKLNK